MVLVLDGSVVIKCPPFGGGLKPLKVFKKK